MLNKVKKKINKQKSLYLQPEASTHPSRLPREFKTLQTKVTSLIFSFQWNEFSYVWPIHSSRQWINLKTGFMLTYRWVFMFSPTLKYFSRTFPETMFSPTISLTAMFGVCVVWGGGLRRFISLRLPGPQLVLVHGPHLEGQDSSSGS